MVSRSATAGDPTTTRPLVAADLPGCLALSSAAGWNQTVEDWRLILSLGEGSGLFDGLRLVATAAVLPYGGRFGWICMVLVAAEARRRGHATRLMRWAIETLERTGLVPGLDATPAGRGVYQQLGFRDIYPLRRLQANACRPVPGEGGVALRPFTAADLVDVSAYDAEAFGADRGALLAALRIRCPQLAFVASNGGRIAGFVLARDGRLATQIGPVVADDDGTSRALLAAALRRVERPVFIDVAERHAAIGTWLEGLGFTTQRQFTRMLLGRDKPLDDPERIFAVAGPELA